MSWIFIPLKSNKRVFSDGRANPQKLQVNAKIIVAPNCCLRIVVNKVVGVGEIATPSEIAFLPRRWEFKKTCRVMAAVCASTPAHKSTSGKHRREVLLLIISAASRNDISGNEMYERARIAKQKLIVCYVNQSARAVISLVSKVAFYTTLCTIFLFSPTTYLLIQTWKKKRTWRLSENKNSSREREKKLTFSRKSLVVRKRNTDQ